MKILILKPSSLGDVVQAIPVLRMLKLHWPTAEVYWWVENASASLLQDDPDLSGIIPFDRKRWGTPWHYGDIWQCVRTIRAHHFDLVIDLQALARSAAIAWIANASHTVGLQDWREMAPGFYDRSTPRPSRRTHAVDWYLQILGLLDVPVRWDFEWLPVRASASERVKALLPSNGLAPIILQPGARWANKRWPVEHFAELVRVMSQRDPDQKFVVIGGKSDQELAAEIVAAVPDACVDLTGRTSVPEVVEVIRSGSVMVTNDSGPMHIAAALGKPVVGLFGPTNPLRTGPYRQVHDGLQRQDLPCVPCMKPYCTWAEPLACLRGLSPARVADTVSARLRARA